MGWFDDNAFTASPAVPSGSQPIAGPTDSSFSALQPQMQTGGGQYPLASVTGEGLMAPWTTPFQRPDPQQIQNDPSFQFQMQQGTKALERSAAARGTLLTGRTLQELTRFGQGLASTFDDKYYNRGLGEYQMAHDIFSGNQNTQYNRLAGLAGLGQNSAQNLGQMGSSYANNAGNIMTAQGNAAGASQIAQGNAWGGFLNGLGGLAMGGAAMWPQGGGGQTGSSYPPVLLNF